MSAREFFDDARRLGATVVRAGYESYLRDESRFQGRAHGVIRPLRPHQVADVVALAGRRNMPLTVVSGKTSLTGSCVPVSGVVLDLKNLNTVDAGDPARVGPGVVLKHYKDRVHDMGLFYPPDPTSEESCTLGGNAACNASGALSYLYGPTRAYIRGMKLVIASGSTLDLERGQVQSRDGFFTVPAHLFSPASPHDLVIPVPRRGAPRWSVCKSAAGLYTSDPMDLLDLFIGSEGILAVTIELRTVLLPRRRSPYFGLILYVPSREIAVALVTLLDNFKRMNHDKDMTRREHIAQGLNRLTGSSDHACIERFESIVPACMEWFSSSVQRFLTPARAGRLKAAYGCLYVEQEFSPDQDPMDVASEWAELVEFINKHARERWGSITTEVALDEKHIRQVRMDRKAVPEKLNELIQPGMVKIGMDYSVPMEHLDRLMKRYDETLPKGATYIFGHIGNAHLHVNLVPDTKEQEHQYRSISSALAREVCTMNGSVSGEHGIGKLKRDALTMMLGPEGIDEIVRIKRVLDPKGILNPGNMVLLPEQARSRSS